MRGELSLTVDVLCEIAVIVQPKKPIKLRDLVVDGETFGCVKILCYLGDTWWNGSCYNSLELKVEENISDRCCHF